jgi:hypothetical protein
MNTRLQAWLCSRKPRFRSCRFLPQKGQKGPLHNGINKWVRLKNAGASIAIYIVDAPADFVKCKHYHTDGKGNEKQ